MKAGFYQFSPKFGEIKKNVKKTVDAIEAADVNLIVLPELFNTGTSSFQKRDKRTFRRNPFRIYNEGARRCCTEKEDIYCCRHI